MFFYLKYLKNTQNTTQHPGKTLLLKSLFISVISLGASATLASPSGIKDQIINFLSDQAQPYANTTFSTIEVTLAPNSESRLAKADCAIPTISMPKGASPTGRTSVALSCPDGQWKARLTAQVSLINTVPVASRTLSPGTTLTESDWMMADVDITAWRRGVILNNDNVNDLVISQGLKAGEPIPPSNNSNGAASNAIKAGSVLEVLIIGDGFIVRSSGNAVQSGKPGDTIRAKLESGKTVSGRLNAEKQLEVKL